MQNLAGVRKVFEPGFWTREVIRMLPSNVWPDVEGNIRPDVPLYPAGFQLKRLGLKHPAGYHPNPAGHDSYSAGYQLYPAGPESVKQFPNKLDSLSIFKTFIVR